MPTLLANPKPQTKRKLLKRARVTWEYVGKADSEHWFRNVRAIHRTPKGHVVTWFRIVVPAPDIKYAMQGASKFVWSELLEENGYRLQLWEFNCSTNQMRPLQDVSYNGEGKVTSQHLSGDSHWSYAVPDSIGEATLHGACRRVKTSNGSFSKALFQASHTLSDSIRFGTF
jgi:hypothetical protein